MWTNLVSLLFLDICILIIIYFDFGFIRFESSVNRWDENADLREHTPDDPQGELVLSSHKCIERGLNSLR